MMLLIEPISKIAPGQENAFPRPRFKPAASLTTVLELPAFRPETIISLSTTSLASPQGNCKNTLDCAVG
jgi:hypothetical protein